MAAWIRTIRAIMGSAMLRAPYTVIIAANPVRCNRPRGFFRNEEYSQMAAHTEGSANSRMTAAVPPTNSAMGFLNTRHDTDSGDISASSLNGRLKSLSPSDSPYRRVWTVALRRRCRVEGRRIAEFMGLEYTARCGRAP